MKKKLTIVISHPIQYHAPLYRVIEDKGLFDLHVIYHNDRGIRPYFEKLANCNVSYDNDLLKGYSYEFLTQGKPASFSERFRYVCLPELENRILQSKPDAVYFHGYNHLAHIRAIFGLRKKGLKLFLRGENNDVLAKPRLGIIAREALLKVLLPCFDAILYIGHENKNFFLRRGVPEPKLFFVPYSADNRYFGLHLSDPEVESIRLSIRAEYGIPSDAIVFINTCKHRQEKRLLDVLEAYVKAFGSKNIVLKNKPCLLLVGDGPLNKRMRAIVEQSGLTSIVFTGYVNQSKMRELILASDYMVDAGAEPWGCVFNEALPAGLGLISSDHVVGHPDMVKVGENGFTHRLGDIDELGRIFEKCAQDPELLKRFRIASRRIALKYSYEECVTGLYQALTST